MAFRKINEKIQLSGFFARNLGNTCEGVVVKYVDKEGGPFFILKLNQECNVMVQDEKTKKVKAGIAKAGQNIGVSAVLTLSPLKELVGKIVRLTFTGTTPSKKFPGKDVSLFNIEVDDAVDEPAPF